MPSQFSGYIGDVADWIGVGDGCCVVDSLIEASDHALTCPEIIVCRTQVPPIEIVGVRSESQRTGEAGRALSKGIGFRERSGPV